LWEIDNHIQKDEKIIYAGSPEWSGYYMGFIFVILTIFTIIIPIIILGRIYLHKLSTKYVVTDKKVFMRAGILSEDFKSSTYKHITSIRIKQGIIGKIFGFGHIVIDTSGSGSGFEFVWFCVKNPLQVKNEIEKLVD